MRATQRVPGSTHRSKIADWVHPPGSPAVGPEAARSPVASACHGQTSHETWSPPNNWRQLEPCSTDRRGPAGSLRGCSEHIPTPPRARPRTALDPCCARLLTDTALPPWPFPCYCPTCSLSSGRDRDPPAAESLEIPRKPATGLPRSARE